MEKLNHLRFPFLQQKNSPFHSLSDTSNWPDVMAHICNPSTLEAEAGGLSVWGQPGRHRNLKPAWTIKENLSQKKKDEQKLLITHWIIKTQALSLYNIMFQTQLEGPMKWLRDLRGLPPSLKTEFESSDPHNGRRDQLSWVVHWPPHKYPGIHTNK